jgi:multidrug efflux pump subunit AcrA (membrane-fusion protein)
MTEHNSHREGTLIIAFTGWAVVLGIIGFLWISETEPTQGQAPTPPPAQPQLVTTPPVSTEPRVLNFTLTLSEPDDLKVRQGDFVNAGDVLADRSRERTQLQVQLQKTQISLQRIQSHQVLEPPQPLPVPPVSQLPPVNYSAEEAQISDIEQRIDLQQRKIDLLGTMSPSEVPPAMREHEDRILEQLYRDLEAARAALRQAQDERAHKEYEYSLAMARRAEEANQQQLAFNQQRQQADQQRREKTFQEAQLQAQLEAINAKLSDLSTVRSPYAGTIRRVKWIGQSDNRLTVEITLAVGGSAGPTTTGIQSSPGSGGVGGNP